jgi:hypothetical protein
MRIKTNKNMGKILVCLLFIFVFLIANASAKLAFDNDCPVSASNKVNFSSGTAVSLPFTYAETSMASSNLAIFLGTDTSYFCSQIDDDLSTFAASRTVIFTPEFLNALKTSSCNASFEDYMENYRKSGNMLSSAGTVFCGVKNLTFDSTTSPSGITFDYTIVGAPVGVNGTHYNGPSLKKYMIAYLMNHPDAELSGIILTFANAINLNVSLSCPDSGSISDFFNSGKGNYTTKFQPKLRGIDYGSGESLSPSNGVSGAFGWLLDFALGDQTLPIITAANLSTNKIYVCGINSIEEYYSNNTVTTSGRAVNITTAEINTSLEIKTNSDISNATIEIFEYTGNPKADGALSVAELDRYFGIKADAALENAISSVIIKVYYTHEEVSTANLDESTLRLYYYNTISGKWVKYDSPNGGVNTTNNYVWANTTHFSDWGIFGTALASATTSTSSGSGGSIIKWECEEWTKCNNGKQSRICYDPNLKSSKKTDIRDCITIPIVSAVIPTSPAKRVPETIPQQPSAPSVQEKAPAVPLEMLWYSIIAFAVIIATISWIILNKKPSKKKKKGCKNKRRNHLPLKKR